MKTDESLKKDVQDVIQWETFLKAKEIAIIVADGIVTLSGIVDSHSKKVEAEKAVINVGGIKGIVDNLKIRKNLLMKKNKWNYT